jgi:molybdate transport system substrate-binding protein
MTGVTEEVRPLSNIYKSLRGLLLIENEAFLKSSAVKFLIFVIGWTMALAMPSAAQLTIAAAADLSAALEDIVASYEKSGGGLVRLSFGSSGSLFNQIQNGAPFDVFFSADLDYPNRLIDAGLAQKSSLYRYAVGQLVLWVEASSPLDVEHRGMGILLDPSVKKISLANPEHAPYGRAAVVALRHFGLYEKVAGRFVLGENVSQAAHFVESGNAQVGFVALSHALAPGMKEKGRYWLIPFDSYPALQQAVVILSHSSKKKAAAAFLDHLKKPESRDLLRHYGFSVPEKTLEAKP